MAANVSCISGVKLQEAHIVALWAGVADFKVQLQLMVLNVQNKSKPGGVP